MQKLSVMSVELLLVTLNVKLNTRLTYGPFPHEIPLLFEC